MTTASWDWSQASVLVTGGTGSFGKHFVKTVLERYKPKRLIIFSRDELKQYEMAQICSTERPVLRYFIGDVRDRERLERALHGVDYRHPRRRAQAGAGGRIQSVRVHQDQRDGRRERHRCGASTRACKRVIALSTDKAANPINLYGATKLCSDKLFVAGNNLAGRRWHALRGRALRQRRRLARQRGAVLPASCADERANAADHRSRA